ncbi:hypothetical protein M3J09_003991 [Ascochyta lentis]
MPASCELTILASIIHHHSTAATKHIDSYNHSHTLEVPTSVCARIGKPQRSTTSTAPSKPTQNPLQ